MSWWNTYQCHIFLPCIHHDTCTYTHRQHQCRCREHKDSGYNRQCLEHIVFYFATGEPNLVKELSLLGSVTNSYWVELTVTSESGSTPLHKKKKTCLGTYIPGFSGFALLLIKNTTPFVLVGVVLLLIKKKPLWFNDFYNWIVPEWWKKLEYEMI